MSVFENLKFILDHPLNQNQKRRTLLRWLNWQLRSRFARGFLVVPFANGIRLKVKTGMTGATGNIYCGLHEFESMAFVLHLLRPGDLFIDVGANVGTYSLLAASRGSQSLAFEPVEETRSYFDQNVKINGFETIITISNVVLSDKIGTIKMSTELDTVNHVVNERKEKSIKTAVMNCETLDRAITGGNPVMIKIDVEGHEPQVLSGALGVLRKESLLAVIMEVNAQEAHEKIIKSGFNPYQYSPFDRSLLSLSGPNKHSPNTLYIKDLDAVKDRLMTAPPFSVFERWI